jgi:hypothetical protein
MRIKGEKYQYVEVRRTSMWITPCKRSAARGKEVSPSSSELRKEFNPLRGWEMGGVILYPELRFACTGLSTLNTFGVPLIYINNKNNKIIVHRVLYRAPKKN